MMIRLSTRIPMFARTSCMPGVPEFEPDREERAEEAEDRAARAERRNHRVRRRAQVHDAESRGDQRQRNR